MTYEPPPDLVGLKRDFIIIDAGLTGPYDFNAGMEQLRELSSLMHQHPWWKSVANRFDASLVLTKAAKAALPEGFPETLPAEMPTTNP